MERFVTFLLCFFIWKDICVANKLQGYRFLDNNSSKFLVPGQGKGVTRDYPGKEFPLHLSLCLKFKLEYDRFEQIGIMSISKPDSDWYIELFGK